MQSYIDQYRYEQEQRLRVFDGQFKPQIDGGRRRLLTVCTIHHVLALLLYVYCKNVTIKSIASSKKIGDAIITLCTHVRGGVKQLVLSVCVVKNMSMDKQITLQSTK